MMGLEYPKEVVDGYELEYWKVSGPGYLPKRFTAIFHVKATYHEATGDNRPDAKDLVNQWLVYEEGKILIRVDGWQWFRDLESKRVSYGGLGSPRMFTNYESAKEASQQKLKNLIAGSQYRIAGIRKQIQKYEENLISLEIDTD